MMRPQPMLVVADVEAASAWFQNVLGLSSGHGGSEYEMLMDNSDLVVQLHRWDAAEHPNLGDPEDPSRGNGVVVWFETDAFEEAVERVEEMGAEILEGPLFNPNAQQHEIWLSGPDGFVVVVAGSRRP